MVLKWRLMKTETWRLLFPATQRFQHGWMTGRKLYIYKWTWKLTSSIRKLDEAFPDMKFTLPKLSDLSIVKSILVFRITVIMLFLMLKDFLPIFCIFHIFVSGVFDKLKMECKGYTYSLQSWQIITSAFVICCLSDSWIWLVLLWPKGAVFISAAAGLT